MQVGALSSVAIKSDRYVISATAEILSVQRLVYVADEVQDELQGFIAGSECGVWVQDDGCLFLFRISSSGSPESHWVRHT